MKSSADLKDANADLKRELNEAHQRQAAAADVLKAISRSNFDLQKVLDRLVKSVHRLCEVEMAGILRPKGEFFQYAASSGYSPDFVQFMETHPIRLGRGTVVGRTLLESQPVHVPDVLHDPEYTFGDAQKVGNFRSMLGVPLLCAGTAIGVIVLMRKEIRPFTNKQIELVRTFANHAVVAMENARLLSETREALEQQTATAEVFRVINTSPGDLAAVFDTLLEKATVLCEAKFGTLWTYDGEWMSAEASRGAPFAYFKFLRGGPHRMTSRAHQRLLGGKPFVQIADITIAESFLSGEPLSRAAADLGGVRTILLVPLRKGDTLLGSLGIYRQEVRPFTERQIALLQHFGAQAVVAMENVRLLEGIRAAKDSAETALGDLKAAQASLIQAEKMASLGQLTAGIAHEIKNPLNFVNNFANLSVELLEELKEAAAPALAALDDDRRAEIEEVVGMITGNLEKIAEHGRRADGIVKSMLAHSRGGSGDRQTVDVNALIEETLNLAYHGARAQDQTFNIALERAYDKDLAAIEIVPQDIARVFLNLFGNGFYAAMKRKREGGDASFAPVLTVSTHECGETVEVRVRDNGTGIPAELREKLFQPFFTTKPTGEGTGLGLSISYDIVTQQHGGTIDVESVVGSFTEFTVRLPRSRRGITGKRE